MMMKLLTDDGWAYVVPTDITAMKTLTMREWCSAEQREKLAHWIEVVSCSGEYSMRFASEKERDAAAARIAAAIEAAQCQECGR